MIDELIADVQRAIDLADQDISKLSPDIYAIDGMSGRRVRQVLNHICAIPGRRYLEVGSWHGSTLISALYGNELTIQKAMAFDNFSEFNMDGDAAECFTKNTQQFIAEWFQEKLTFHNCEFFANLEMLQPLNPNTYFYDGDHSPDMHAKAVTSVLPYLSMPCVMIVDDWNAGNVQEGFRLGSQSLGDKIVSRWEIPSDYCNHAEGWWCGLLIAILAD